MLLKLKYKLYFSTFLCQLLWWIIFSNYQRPPVNHPDDVSEPSMTAPTSPIMPSPRSPIIRKVPLKVQTANLYTFSRIFHSNYFGKFCYLFQAARQKNAFQYNWLSNGSICKGSSAKVFFSSKNRLQTWIQSFWSWWNHKSMRRAFTWLGYRHGLQKKIRKNSNFMLNQTESKLRTW